MEGQAVSNIADLARKAAGSDTLVTVREEPFSTIPLHPVRPHELEEPDTLVVHSLSGLTEYLKAHRDGYKEEDVLVHIVGPREVRVVSHLKGPRAQRFVYLRAETEDRVARTGLPFRFGSYTDVQTLIIVLQAGFAPSEDLEKVRSLLSKLKDTAELKQEDDGFTQTVSGRTGVVLEQQYAVPNPVHLAPFRTFAEVEQPAGPFVLRLKGGNGKSIEAALFEADGGAWQTTAVASIRRWLDQELPDGVEIIG